MHKEERWRKIEEVFHAAAEQPLEIRREFLESSCSGDDRLLDEVQSLLDSHSRQDQFLEKGPAFTNVHRLHTGDVIGHYRIEDLIGSGGMGEVYRAYDSRLQRQVAIKVLPALAMVDASRLARFEIEARSAGSLNDPNILVVYEVCTHEGSPYLVSELLEGETLRALMKKGKLNAQKTSALAQQIASGLAAAHSKGIVHRDIKPENLFLTKSGTLKIIDFGIVFPPEQGLDGPLTDPGTLLGTAPYASPEQASGAPVDTRSDLFSLGCVIYELLTGAPPFRGGTGVEILCAILTAEPLASPELAAHPALERIVHRCLEKDPDARFQSARDLKFALETLGESRIVSKRPHGRPALLAALLVGTSLLSLLAGYFVYRNLVAVTRPQIQRLTFQRGRVGAARFTPDGASVVYSAAWNGGLSQLYAVQPGSPESRPLGFLDSELLSISSKGELALLVSPHVYPHVTVGKVARVPFAGGTPRDIRSKSCGAVWSTEGKEPLLISQCSPIGGGAKIEDPAGLHTFTTGGWISDPVFLPRYNGLAFIDHPENSTEKGFIAVLDTHGKKRVLGRRWNQIRGMAWNAKTHEIWFTASESGVRQELWAIDLKGRQRFIFETTENIVLQDISTNGRVLLKNEDLRTKTLFFGTGDRRERDLSLLDGSVLNDLSADGKTVVLGEGDAAFDGHEMIYLKDTAGQAPPTRLGPGSFGRISPDGLFVAARSDPSTEIVVYSTKEGQPIRIPLGGLSVGRLNWIRQSPSSPASLIFSGTKAGRDGRLFGISPTRVGELGPLKTFNINAMPYRVSPDGTRYILHDENQTTLKSFDGTESQSLPDYLRKDGAMAVWNPDGQRVYFTSPTTSSLNVFCYDLRTKKVSPWREIRPDDPAGLMSIVRFAVAADNMSYAYSYWQALSVLHIIDGL